MISHPDQLDTEVPVPLIQPVEHHRCVFVLELRGTHCQVSLSLSPQTGWDTQLAVWTKRERMSVPRVPSQASSHPTHTHTHQRSHFLSSPHMQCSDHSLRPQACLPQHFLSSSVFLFHFYVPRTKKKFFSCSCPTPSPISSTPSDSHTGVNMSENMLLVNYTWSEIGAFSRLNVRLSPWQATGEEGSIWQSTRADNTYPRLTASVGMHCTAGLTQCCPLLTENRSSSQGPKDSVTIQKIHLSMKENSK